MYPLILNMFRRLTGNNNFFALLAHTADGTSGNRTEICNGLQQFFLSASCNSGHAEYFTAISSKADIVQ